MAGAQGGERSHALRYTGAPVETIDAMDQLEAGQGKALEKLASLL